MFANLIHPIPGQMFLMDRFFNGAFLTFGLEVKYRDFILHIIFLKGEKN